MAAYNKVPPEKWKFVNVGIAPSTITITEHVCLAADFYLSLWTILFFMLAHI